MMHTAISNYANNTTPHACLSNLSIISEKLKKGTEHFLKWFVNKRLKTNPERV